MRVTMAGTRAQGGQSITELVIMLPVLLLLLVAMADYARLIATTIAVEAAAREAADYGTLYPWLWDGSPGDPGSNHAKTIAEMRERACIATSDLPDYVGPDDSCVNPAVAYDLDASDAGVAESDCGTVARTATPCDVRVTLTFVVRMLLPMNFQLGGVEIGLPSTITVTRTSVFALSDFAIDGP